MTLYHHTCDHGREQIGDEGDLLSGATLKGEVIFWPMNFVWLTTMRHPNADALGLTKNALACDRTAHTYEVTLPDDHESILPWAKVARDLPRELRDELELAPGVMPALWYVSLGPVPARLIT